MRNIISAFEKRDAGALARIAAGEPMPEARGVGEGVERLVDVLFANLKQLFPASVSTALKDPRDEAAAKRQWIAAFAENGIINKQQLAAGMSHARASDSPFWPSPGQFVAWCKAGEAKAAGLPTADELVDLIYQYCRTRGLYPDAESYPWPSNAHYWIVTSLYQNMRANCLSDAELRRKAVSELIHMADRINRGEAIPEPKKALPVLGGKPVSRAQGLAKIAEIKARYGFKGKN